ncbi:MAG: SBBP repeat-containing protein [Vicingaceae bacterium]
MSRSGLTYRNYLKALKPYASGHDRRRRLSLLPRAQSRGQLTAFRFRLFALNFLLFAFSSSLKAQDYEWARSFGSTSTDIGSSITIDVSGNVYTTGYFEGTVDFDPGVGVSNLTSNGNYDVFIQKLDASGNFLWAKSFGANANDVGLSIAVDASGNVYTTGYFWNTVDFDPGAGTFNLTAPGGWFNIFIQKLDASGNFQWAQSYGGGLPDLGYSIAVDASGNVYTTGYFQQTIDFDPGPSVVNLTSVGNDDVFIQKLDASGNFVWAKSFGGGSDDQGFSISVDASGNVYTTGNFKSTVDFDPGAGTANLTAVSNADVFVQKLDASGNYLWAKSFTGNTATDVGRSVTVDLSGNVYTTGNFWSTVDFDPGLGTANLTSAGIQDVFVHKLDASGNFLWAKRLGGGARDEGYSIAVDTSGNVYTIGFVTGTIDLDPGPGVTNPTGAGFEDIYILKLDAFGNYLWAERFGSGADDQGRSIKVDASGNIYAIGFFRGTVDFDPGAGTTNLTSVGNEDIFIQKLSQCAPTTSTDVQTACGNFTWIDGNTYTSSNNTAKDTLVNAAGCDSIVTLNLTINSSNTQTQKGADLDGEAAGDESGWSVSMPDAQTLAIGAPRNDGSGSDAGHVRVYSWNGSAWVQKGADIDGEAAGDRSGWSVSMPDANTLAIGAILNDGNGSSAGHVRIYTWNGSAWTQKGADIDGEAAFDQSGFSVSMPDANTVAIGASYNDGNGNFAGHARVYSWNGSAWVQKGADLDGEAAGDQLGYSVSMPDANTLATGAYGNDGNGNAAGHVRVYSWNGSAWVQKGADIDGEAASDQSGFSVSMPDANTLAIGASGNDGNGSLAGHVRIYSWNGSAWVQKGADIDGEAASDQSGYSVSMPDANTLAIGAPGNAGNGTDAGHVRIYSWNGSAWVQQGADIEGEAADDYSGSSVCMPDANTVAIGAYLNDGNGSNAGHVRIYTLCSCTETNATLSVLACNNYTAPSGAVFSTSGTFQDTIPNLAGCDSVITINLDLNPPTTVTWTGAVDSLWHSPCNWSNYQVPLCCQTANIPNTTIKPYINDTALAESLLVDTDNGGRTFINPTGKLFINDCTHEATVDTGNYVIGSAGPACGIVFYDKGSYSNGWRYLEAMPFDQNGGAGISWGPASATGATSSNIGDGLTNTSTIVSSYGAGSYAAQVANDLTHNGYSDWFLPTEDELNLMYSNLHLNGAGGFSTSTSYWSSTEFSGGNAVYQSFGTGVSTALSKSSSILVRAIRRF